MKKNLEIFKKTNDENINKNPNALAYNALIKFKNTGNIEESKRQLEEAIDIDSHCVQAYVELVDILYLEGKKQEANKILKNAIKINPNNSTLRGRFGLLLKEQNKLCWAKLQITLAKNLEENIQQKEQWNRILNRINIMINDESQIENGIEWTMARKDCYRSSCVSKNKSHGQMNISHKDSYSFDSPITQRYLPDIPSPIIAEDIIILPDESLKSFKGLKISGLKDTFWKSGLQVHRLTYSSTPIYVHPYLFFPVENSIKRVKIIDTKATLETISTKHKLKLHPYCSPITYLNIVIFPFRDHVYCYDIDEEKGEYISLDLSDQQDTLRSPVIFNGELIFTSQKGEILKLDILTQSIIKEDSISVNGIYSAPCVLGENLYFEFFDETSKKRNIAAYAPADGSFVMETLSNEACSKEDIHYNFSPIVFHDSVLIASDESAVYYQIRRLGETLEVIPLELNIQAGHQKIVRVSHEFSTVYGSYLISKCDGGFFYVDLDNLTFNKIENLVSNMIAQPVIHKSKVYFLCQKGLEVFQL